MKLLRCTILFALAAGFESTVAVAQADDNPIALLDRMAFALTGMPASPEDVNAYLTDGESLASIADKLRKSSAFETRLSQYWLQTLGINAPVRFDDIIDRGVNRSVATSLNAILKTPAQGGGGGISGVFCTNLLVPDVTPAVRQKAIGSLNQLYRITVPASNSEFNELQGCACNDQNNQPIAGLPRAVAVTPYWDTSTQVLVCPKVKTYCGDNLASCFPTTFNSSLSHYAPLFEPIQEALTLEPGLMVARIVAEDQSWDEVLRGTKRLVNGPLAVFIRDYGKPYLDAAPPRSYGDITKGPVATLTKTDRSYHWVEGGNLNVGVLSTVSFQRSTNGWRAKAARTLRAFMCRDFIVPDGVAQVPSAEAELTRKPYCQSCHVVLEPLSQLFGRWPTLGDTNYFYNEATGVSAIGQYAGVVDADTVGLARIMTNLKDFNQCAVRRAFDFVVGRNMTDTEAALMLDPLVTTFMDSNKRLWPVMQKIIESPAFTGVKP